jgi:hypothetical protein
VSDAIENRIKAREAGGKPRTAWRMATYAEAQVTRVIAMAAKRGALDRGNRGAPALFTTLSRRSGDYFARV